MSKPINHKCQLGTEANCKLLLHMNEASWNGTPDEVKDASGCGNHGVASGGVTTIADGKFGRCGGFDGVDDKVACGDDASILMNGKSFTVSMWINPQKDGTNNGLFRYGGAVMRAYILNSVSKPYIRWKNLANTYISYKLSESQTLENTWSHIAFTYDATSDTFVGYVNGNIGLTHTSVGGLYTATAGWDFGYGEVAYGYFLGAMDEVALYDRVLSAQEIYQHYHAQIGMHII